MLEGELNAQLDYDKHNLRKEENTCNGKILPKRLKPAIERKK